jgi:hypothetical protein
MSRRRSAHFGLPRNLTRDKSGNLRYKRPDTSRYISLHGHGDLTAIRAAEAMNAAFGPVPLRGHRHRYRESFAAFDWSAVDDDLRQIIAAKCPDVFDTQGRVLGQG